MSRAAPKGRARSGVALGVLGLMLLAFFTVVFMIGRPGYWKSFDDFVHHPFDPHPIGIDKRHKEDVVVTLTGADGRTEAEIVVQNQVSTIRHQGSTGGSGAASGVTGDRKHAAADKPEVKQQPQDVVQQLDQEHMVEHAHADDGKQIQPADGQQQGAGRGQSAEQQPTAGQQQGAGQGQSGTEQQPTAAEQQQGAGRGQPGTEQQPSAGEQKPQAQELKKEAQQAVKPVTKASSDDGGDDDGDGKLTALDNEYKPTREMVQKIAQNGYLVVTWANYHYMDFVRTWVKHVQAVGITGYIVGAMDDHLLKELIRLNYNCFSMKSGLTLGDFGWGSPTFAKMGREKIRLISIFLQLDVQVVIADVDVLWLRNPLPFFDRFPEADVLTSSDNMAATVTTEELEKFPEAGAAANIGIMVFRKNSLAFVEDWIQVIEADEKVWDQNAFNDLFRRGIKIPNPPQKNLFQGYDGNLTIGILPVSQFCSGHTMFVQRLGERLGLKPYAVHATFQFSGTPGKRNRMREFMMYDDPPEYYDHKVGFVSFDMDGLPELLPNAGPNTGDMSLANVQGHFRLMNHQIHRIRQGFAISSVVLGRALVMPELWCGLDRWWAPHQGRIPGAMFDLPFKCPLDHLLDLENGIFKLPSDDHFGPATEIREYSFFHNPRMTVGVKEDRVVVEMCNHGDSSCSDGSSPAPLVTENGVQKVRVQQGLMSDQLSTALTNAKTFKVMHFTTMVNALGNFSNPQQWTRFQERMKLYGSIWCCVHAHPGHIHYDMQWDVIPHNDKFGRTWNTSWSTVTGP